MIVLGSAAWACVPTGGARALTLNPAQAKPGTEVAVTGTTGDASKPIELHLGSSDGTLLATIPAGQNPIEASFTVPEGTPQGDQVVVAVQEGVKWPPIVLTVLSPEAIAPPPSATPSTVSTTAGDETLLRSSALGIVVALALLGVAGLAAVAVRRRAAAAASNRGAVAGVDPAALVLLAGAGAFALLRPSLDALTPLLGVIVLGAGVLAGSRHLLPSGWVLVGWGAAIVALSQGVVPQRGSSLHVVGIAAGLLVAAKVARSAEERASFLTTASITTFSAGAIYYLAYNYTQLGEWPWWALTLVAWAAAEQVSAMRAGRRIATDPPVATEPVSREPSQIGEELSGQAAPNSDDVLARR